MTPTITPIYAVPLALLALVLWVRVSSLRARLRVSIGDGGDPALHERIRQHGNFAETVPLVLILMGLAEAQGVAPVWLHAAGVLLLAGRILHPLGLRADNAAHPLRILGNTGGLLATVILIVGLATRMLA